MKANLLTNMLLGLLLISLGACGGEGSTPAENAQLDSEQADSSKKVATVSETKEAAIPEGFQKITWDQLADVRFEVRYFEDAQDSLLFPAFGEAVQAMATKKIAISGYVIPITYDRYVLSANPFSQCFFCGNAGPESVMELNINDLEGILFHTDEFRTFTGVFKLNDLDVNQLNYLLEDARAL
ncbi:MAG: DUF3299 domain-containing protein [Bacteroidia bacterium]